MVDGRSDIFAQPRRCETRLSSAPAVSLDSRTAARLSRCVGRLVRIRTHSPRRPREPHPRSVFLGGDRRTTGTQLLDRFARFGGSQPDSEPAHLVKAEALLQVNTMPPGFVIGLLNPFSLTGRAFNTPGARELVDHNRDELRAVEMPASNGIGTARSVAKLYGCVATGGSEIGMTPGALDALITAAVPPVRGLREPRCCTSTRCSRWAL